MADPITFSQLVKVLGFLQALSQQLPAPDPSAAPQQFAMPRSAAEVGTTVLQCYHPTGVFHSVDVVERPWRRASDYKAADSVLLRLNWHGGLTRSPYQTYVALVTRDQHIRAVVQSDSSIIPHGTNCALNDWVKVAGTGTKSAPPQKRQETDLNQAREQIEALVEVAAQVALGGKKIGQEQEAVSSDLIAKLAKQVLAVKSAMESKKETKK